jgi:phenylacetate-CoA ligase
VLDNLVMPFIRYNLHDIAQHAASPCPCGRTLPLLNVIAGRKADMMHLPDGRRQSPLGFLVHFDGLGEVVNEYQIVQEAVDRFRITVVPGACFDATAGEKIGFILRSRYPSAQVSVIVVDRIQREPSGKLRAFLSQVSDDHRGLQHASRARDT